MGDGGKTRGAGLRPVPHIFFNKDSTAKIPFIAYA